MNGTPYLSSNGRKIPPAVDFSDHLHAIRLRLPEVAPKPMLERCREMGQVAEAERSLYLSALIYNVFLGDEAMLSRIDQEL
jgi:hypothetical protein